MLEVGPDPRGGRIGCLNWPEAFSYRPEAEFDLCHDGGELHLRFRVRENAVRAVCAADREHAWEDSCVEFFFDPHGDGSYYNLECTCIGKLYLCRGEGRHGREFLPEAAYAAIRRRCSLGTEPFGLRESPTAWEVERVLVMFQEKRFKVRQRVLFAEQTPDTLLKVGIAGVKLDGLHFGELLNQGFINNEVLVAVLSWRLVLMLTNALSEKLRHPEMWIAQ